MAFDPIRFPDLPPILSAPRGESRRAGDRSTFEDSLAEALESAGGKTGREKALAQILQLGMLRTSLFLESAEEPADLGGRQVLESLVQRYTAGRNFDLRQSPYASASPAASPNTAPADLPSSPKKDGLEGIIARASDRYRIAPEVVRAVIRAESDFNPRAVSPAGAQGLMQLMPGTAGDMGVKDAFDPEQNVMGGTRYLRQMLDRYDGDLEKALAAYNWGPGNLDRSDGSLPRETRAYIARIQGLLARDA